jgi:hypothetical protein
MQHVTINNNQNFGYSLSRSPKLRHLAFYKVWGLGVEDRCFAPRLVLPNIEYLSLSRSDDVNHLVLLYAPKLTDFNLQACFDIETVSILNHLASSLPWLTTHYPDVAERISNNDPDYTEVFETIRNTK